MKTSEMNLNNAVAALQSNKYKWAKLDIGQRISIVNEIIEKMKAISERWVDAELKARGMDPESEEACEAWLGVSFIFRFLHTLRKSLQEISRNNRPLIPGYVRTREDGQVVVPVVPRTLMDRLLKNQFLYKGMTAEIWMEPGVKAEEVISEQANEYNDNTYAGCVTLILGAGNHGFILVGEILYNLFVKLRTAILKMNPVNDYLGPLLEEAFRELIEQDFLKIAYGDVAEGRYLTNHAGVEEIHMTGSDKTYEAIVFGPGEEGTKRKLEKRPLITKQITAELGSVNPIIIVPGQWSKKEIRHQAGTVVGTLTHNAGFNCLNTRVIVTHADWPQRNELLDGIREILAHVPTRKAYYPNAHAIYSEFISAHPEAEQFGVMNSDTLPWTFIPDINPQKKDDISFTREPFCSIFSETSIKAETVPEYIEQAVDFVNKKLWGSLTAMVMIHPNSANDPSVSFALEQAVSNLKYGTVGVNVWGGMNYTLGETTWGAFPGHHMYDIQSGTGVVCNMLMFNHPQKTVIRGPFKQLVQPTALMKHFNLFSRKLANFEAKQSPWTLIDLMSTAIKLM
jgi:hypothetical protein